MGGQFKYFERAKERLKWVIPLTLGIVFALLYFNTKSIVETAIVMLAVPFSLVGAIWLLYLLHYNVSVAVWVGVIALAGLDAETGVVMLLYLTLAYDRRVREGRLRSLDDLRESIVEGAAKRLRPKLMTVATMIIGLVPVLWSTGTGADVMKRIAAPMIGGLVTSFLLELTVYPAIFAIWRGRGLEYVCPMHPEIVRDQAGSCPICGMALEPRTLTLDEGPNPELIDMKASPRLVCWAGGFGALPWNVGPHTPRSARARALDARAAVDRIRAGNARGPLGRVALFRTGCRLGRPSQSEHVYVDRARDGQRLPL
jgi:hypothetical protein